MEVTEDTGGVDESVRRSMRISTIDAIFAAQYATLTAGPFLTAFLLALGATAPQIGLVAALPLLGGLLHPAGAEAIRRQGGRQKGILLYAAVVDAALWIVTVGAVLWLSPKAALVVVMIVLGLQQAATAFAVAAWTSWISDLIPARLRGRYFGLRNFLSNAFGALTAVLAGWAIHVAPADPIPIFLAFFALGVASRVISIRYLARQPEPTLAGSPAGGLFGRMKAPLTDSTYRRYLVFGAGWGFSIWFVGPFYTVYMIREAHVSVQAVMAFAALATISNLMGQRVWGGICDRFGDRQVMTLAGLTVAFQPLWWLLTDGTGLGFYLFPLLSVTGGFAWGGFTLATGNLMMRLAPQDGKTVFFAMQAALGGVFGAVGSLLGGVLAGILVSSSGFYPIWLLEGLKSLFLVGFILRAGAWFLMMRIPDPVSRPRLKTVYVVRDTVRSLNPIQGFSPILHTFIAGDRPGQAPVRGRKDGGRRGDNEA
ncbi:MAG: MFS family permease [Thalassolituus oleivorans]|jgi:MFS family permease